MMFATKRGYVTRLGNINSKPLHNLHSSSDYMKKDVMIEHEAYLREIREFVIFQSQNISGETTWKTEAQKR